MSFCSDCAIKGYSMCFCKPIQQPEIKFVSEIDIIKKLQEQNKALREALEKISTDTVQVGFYVEPTWSAQIAKEALVKGGE